MAAGSRRTVVLGVVTNLARLRAIVEHPAFRAGDLHTGFLDEHLAGLPRPECPPPKRLAAAVSAAARGDGGRRRAAPRRPIPGTARALAAGG